MSSFREQTNVYRLAQSEFARPETSWRAEAPLRWSRSQDGSDRVGGKGAREAFKRRSNKKLLVTSATLVVTGATLVVTRFATSNKKLLVTGALLVVTRSY